MGLFTNLLRREEAVFALESEYAAWIFARLGSWPSACTFDYAFLPSITGFPAWLRRLYAFPACFLGYSNPETFYLDSFGIGMPSMITALTLKPLSRFFSGSTSSLYQLLWFPSRMRISISLRLQPILIGPIFNLLSDFWTLASSGPTYISHERSPSGVERKGRLLSEAYSSNYFRIRQ